MRWFAWITILIGTVALIFVGAYEFRLKERAMLVQPVNGKQEVTGRIEAFVFAEPPSVLKGTGHNGSKFVPLEELKPPKAIALEVYTQATNSAKVGAMALLLIGLAGLWLDRWTRKTEAILNQQVPD